MQRLCYQEDMAAPYRGIEHLGVVVADLEAASHTYGQVLGLSLGAREELPARGLAVRLVETGGARIELLAPTRPDSEISKFLAKRGEGLHHVCLAVDDLDATLQALKARGAKLIDEKPRPGAHGTRVAFVHPNATHGVLLELVEKAKGETRP